MLHEVFTIHKRFRNEGGDENDLLKSPIEDSSAQQFRQVPNKNAQKFYELIKDAKQPLYEGCKNFSKLSSIMHLYHLNCLSGWSNNSFTMLLKLLKDMIPSNTK